MATYVVGDIQGCFDQFQCLLEMVKFNPDKDVIWSVGDLINRGPSNLATLRWFHERRDNVVVVLGNHDLHLMAVSAGARKMSKSDNFDDILDAPDRETLIGWLHHQPLIHHEHGATLVHAGIPPMWSVSEAVERAAEVESVLRGPDCIRFFNAMYGNDPIIWSDELTGMTRLRVITNYLTRMRYCTKKGKLDLVSKGPTPTANTLKGKKVAPWFSHQSKRTKDDVVLFGHWASLDGVTDSPNVIALDTGCVWGNKMTLMALESRTFYRCDC
jgi:bis(5'-nucleosyl)-tetraphosphatase (symmetrical)